MNPVLHSAEFQAFKITRGPHWPLRVGDVTKAVLGPGQAHQVILVYPLEQLHADVSVQHLAGVIIVPEQERQVERVDFRYEVAEWAG